MRGTSAACNRCSGNSSAISSDVAGSSVAAAPAHHRPLQRGTVADIEGDPAECLFRLEQRGDVRHVEERLASCRYPIAHGEGPQRMGHTEGLDADRADADWALRLDHAGLGEGKAGDEGQGFGSGIDRARRAVGKTESMVAVRVGEHDGGWIDPLEARKPIGAAIDHHPRASLPHQEGAVTKMAARPDLDLAPSAEKGELDASLLTFLDGDFLLVLLRRRALGQSHREDAVHELRLDLVGIDAIRHGKRTLEGSIASL